jgi:hypothetical protein
MIIFTLIPFIEENEMNLTRRFAPLLFGGLLLITFSGIHAAEPRTENTFRLAEGEERPAASLEDASWLVGSWTGTAFDKQFEETWNPPSAGSMVGLFKVYDDEGVSFYEILLLTGDEGTLSLKVRHFNADFTAWEDKGDFVNFQLVKLDDDGLHFGGLSFYRRDEDNIDAYIVLKSGDEITEHYLQYQRR